MHVQWSVAWFSAQVEPLPLSGVFHVGSVSKRSRVSIESSTLEGFACLRTKPKENSLQRNVVTT